MVKQRLVDVEAWVVAHQYHPEFIGVFEEWPFPHESGEWFWLSCVCGAKVLIGTHPLQATKKKRIRRDYLRT